ncbi:hypothetical protein [Enterococcus phage vB_Efs10_KEN05]
MIASIKLRERLIKRCGMILKHSANRENLTPFQKP